MPKGKILHITARADHGGGPKHIDQLVNFLNEHFDIYLACPTDKPYFTKWGSEKKVKGIIQIPHRKFSLKALFELRKYVNDKEISLVHSHGKGAGVYSRLLKLVLPQIHVIHTFHGVHIFTYTRLQKTAYIIYERVLANFTKRFVNVSYGEKQICIKSGILTEADSTVIYNGSEDLAAGGPQQSKLKVFSPFFVISISRFDISKNMQLAFAIAQKFKHNSNIVFLWVGDGPDKSALQSEAQNQQLNIVFTGFQQDIVKYLRQSAVYLSTSRWEGLPISLIEAASLGIPLVASNVTGNNEVVKHQFNGFLFEPDNPEFAVQAIEQLYQDEACYAQMALKSRSFYEENFHINKMQQAYVHLYKEF